VKWLIVAAALLVGCDKKTEPAKDTGSGSGSGSPTVGSGAIGAVGGTGSAAPVMAATGTKPTCDSGAACAEQWATYFRDRGCKCSADKDKACADAAFTDAMTYFKDVGSKLAAAPDMTPERATKNMELGQEFIKCVGAVGVGPDAVGTAQPTAGGATGAACDNPTCALAAMKTFRDDMCKCTDKDCGMRVTEAMSTWAQEASKAFQNVQPDESVMKEMEQIGKELGDCTTKLMMAGGDMPPTGGDVALPPSTEGFHKKRTTPIGKKPTKKPACLESGKIDSTPCVIDSMGYWADMMCACPDKTCGEALVKDMTKWAEDAAKSAQNTQPTAADMKKMEEIGKRLGECTGDVMLTDPNAK
jgi:hypothetical protein